MANPEHLQILQQGVEVWNQWREQNEGVRPDLSETNLSGAKLPRANLRRTNLSGANLSEAFLHGGNLRGAFLIEADLARANLIRADLIEANLRRGILTRADLVRAFARADDEIKHEIEHDVLSTALWLDAADVAVAVDDGEVTLVGQVERRMDAELAVDLVERVPGVVSVDSRLTWRTKGGSTK